MKHMIRWKDMKGYLLNNTAIWRFLAVADHRENPTRTMTITQSAKPLDRIITFQTTDTPQPNRVG